MTLTYFWKIGWTEPITLFRHDKNKPFLSIDCPPCFYIPTQETSRALFRIKDICEPFVCFKYLFIETLWKETTHGEFYYEAQGILVIFVRHLLILSISSCALSNRLLILSFSQIVCFSMAYLLACHNDRYWFDFRQCLNLLTLKA